jgi:hypothetical protein
MVRAILENRKRQTRRIIGERARAGYPHHDIETAEADGFRTTGGMPFLWTCPYGQPGDRLYVKETYLLRANGEVAVYKADLPDVEAAGFGAMYGGWKSGRFMPKRWSRLTLEITGIRVERVQEISEGDAKAEGVLRTERHPTSYRVAFAELWAKLNGSDSWSSNPWVWAIEFKRADP